MMSGRDKLRILGVGYLVLVDPESSNGNDLDFLLSGKPSRTDRPDEGIPNRSQRPRVRTEPFLARPQVDDARWNVQPSLHGSGGRVRLPRERAGGLAAFHRVSPVLWPVMGYPIHSTKPSRSKPANTAKVFTKRRPTHDLEPQPVLLHHIKDARHARMAT